MQPETVLPFPHRGGIQAGFGALGLPIADPLIGLGITAAILKITWDSWRTVRGHPTTSARQLA